MENVINLIKVYELFSKVYNDVIKIAKKLKLTEIKDTRM